MLGVFFRFRNCCVITITSVVFSSIISSCSPQAQKKEDKKLFDIEMDSSYTDNQIINNLDNPCSTPAYSQEGYVVWGSSVFYDEKDSKYHMYVSRWPTSLPSHPGWMVSADIIHATSDTPSGPYKYSDVALGTRGAQYWDGRSVFNPHVIRYKDKYYMFYAGTTHPFEEPTYDELTVQSKWCILARTNKRIGLAVSDSPYGPWKRSDKPILDTKPNTFYSLMTSNPAPLLQEDGSVIMVFKGRHYQNGQHSNMFLGVAKASKIDGEYKVLNNDKPIIGEEKVSLAEDPFLWKDNKGYHMLFKDQNAIYTGERGAGVLAHSLDAINWIIDSNPKAYTMEMTFDNGTPASLLRMERPYILFKDNKPEYLFTAVEEKLTKDNPEPKSWNMVVPFKK